MIMILSDPVLVDTAMSAVGCQWNHDGSILAVAGMMSTGGDKVLPFYRVNYFSSWSCVKLALL